MTNETKQQRIYKWIWKNKIDVICLQEWYKTNKQDPSSTDFPDFEFKDYLSYTNKSLSTAILYQRTYIHQFYLNKKRR